MQAALATYAETLMIARRSRVLTVPGQGVDVCFLELSGDFYLELVAPHAGNSRLTNYLKLGFYHLCFLTDDLSETRAHLKERGFTALPAFASEAFDGHSCQFFLGPELHLVEIAEMSGPEFKTFFTANLAPDTPTSEVAGGPLAAPGIEHR